MSTEPIGKRGSTPRLLQSPPVCGIAGISGPLGAGDLETPVVQMVAALRHRGPDDQGVHVAPGKRRQAAFGSARLAVRDLSAAGHQPMVGPTRSLTVFNGELYNATELRGQLSTERAFAGRSDTEVALAAYERWGEAFVERLRGMFALAIFDPNEDRLLIARDPMGIKPLYYHHTGAELAFASELRALLEAGLSARRLSHQGLVSFLATGAVEEPNSLVDDVHMLAPGSVLTLVSGRCSTRRYWSLNNAFDDPVVATRAEAQAQVRQLLEGAVRRQLVSDVPLGVFLSGGLDSSTLVGLAAAALGRPPRTTSVVFAEKEYSERPYISAVVSRYETDHDEVELDAEAFRKELPAALRAMDQPTFDGVNTFVVSGLARQAGLTVALSGLGGDELFAGYSVFRTIPRLQEVASRIPPLPTSLARGAARLAYGRGDRARKLARWLSGEANDAYVLQRELLEPALREQIAGDLSPNGRDGRSARAADPVNEISKLELSRYMRNVLLRDADVMSMAHGLEVRVPLLDQELVEYVVRVPGHLKVDRGTEKPLLLGAVADVLPPALLRRPKMGFNLPFERWLRNELRHDVGQTLLDPGFGGQVGRALAPEALTSVWEDFLAGRTSWSRPWALYVAKVWGERHLP